jgi:addiction module RelE/StbE family toxin
MVKITYTKRFKKNYKKFSKQDKDLIKNKIKTLSKDIMHPSLRTKKIKGTDGLFECSVNISIRIIWSYYDNEIIILLDVGHHDILKKY